jgi:hypothetical protein
VKIQPSLFMIGVRSEADCAERFKISKNYLKDQSKLLSFVLDKNNQMITSFFPMLSKESIAYVN